MYTCIYRLMYVNCVASCLVKENKLFIQIKIDIVNEAFSPSPEKIEWAKELVTAFEEQQKDGIVSVTSHNTARHKSSNMI